MAPFLAQPPTADARSSKTFTARPALAACGPADRAIPTSGPGRHLSAGRLRRLAAGLTAAIALGLAGCGGGGGDGDEGASEPLAPVTQDRQPMAAGGSTLAVDGATLDLPAGALAEGTPLGLSVLPADAARGDALYLQIEPAGQRLAQTATLEIRVRGADPEAEVFWLVGGDPVRAPFTRHGPRFELRLDALGFDAEGRRLAAAAGRSRPLAAGGGGELIVAVQSCQAKARTLSGRLNARQLLGDGLDEAELLSDALVDTVTRCTALEAEQIRQAACARQTRAITAARQLPPTTLDTLRGHLRDLLGAESTVHEVDARCSPAVDTAAELRAAVDAYLAVLSIQFGDDIGARELRRLFDVKGDCDRLGLDTACALLTDALFPNVLDGMRRAAFDDCRARGSATTVAQLIDLGVVAPREGPFLGLARYTMPDLELDAAMCTAPSLQVRVFGSNDPLDDRPELDVALAPLRGLADYARHAEVHPPRAGRLVISGPVAVSRCPDGTALDAELVLRVVKGPELARRPHDGRRFALDTAPIDLSIPEALAAAALDPVTAVGMTLELSQEGGQCASLVDGQQVVMDRPVQVAELAVVLASGVPRTGRVTVSVSVQTQVFGLTGTAGVDERRVSASQSLGWSTTADVTTDGAVLPGTTTGLIARAPRTDGSQFAQELLMTSEGDGSCTANGERSGVADGGLRQAGIPALSISLSAGGGLTVSAQPGSAVFDATYTGAETFQLFGDCDPADHPDRRFGPDAITRTASAFAVTGSTTVGADDPVWSGETTVERTIEGSACLNLATAEAFSGDLLGVDARHLECTGTLRVTLDWTLDR